MTQWGGYPPAPPAPPARRNVGAIVLIASLVVLAVVAVGLVVVVAIRRGSHESQAVTQPSASVPSAPGSGSGSPSVKAAALDTCLVGNWKQTQYTATIDFPDVPVDGKPLGSVKVDGGGRTWDITADGTSTSDYSGAKYTGKDANNRSVVLTFTGVENYQLHTANGQILFDLKGTTVKMITTVDGKQFSQDDLSGGSAPQSYTCGTDTWWLTSSRGETASTTFKRA